MMFVGLFLTPSFLIALFYLLRFTWSQKGKTEEGKAVLNASYAKVAPNFLIGWFAIELYHDWIQPLSFSAYRDLMWILVLITFIFLGANLFRYRIAAVA
ncbi:hypothetical protein [Halobacillus aidingensis]|uniref:Uncharacterized protein n=1 Tax=Halobacillus aidingensis TaxID=240303 RepID=A0A1H0LVC8_HALAD|nr:hypothetical protein [Halobacillus aidingensis]SDO72189.1 hypothetical protein SAMN05421677_107138 [Halobacillus aidingensis]